MEFGKDFLIEAFSEALSLNAQELTDALEAVESKEDAKSYLLEKASGKIKSIRQTSKDMYYGRATKEQKQAAEKLVKEKLGIDSDGKLDEILDFYIESQQALGDDKSKKKDLTIQDMLKHEELREHIKNKYLTPLETAKQQLEAERNATEQLKHSFSLKARGKDVLSEIGAQLSDDAATRKKQIQAYELLMSQHKFKQFDDDVFYAVDEHGDRLVAQNGIDYVKYSDLAKSNWMFGFKEANKPQSQKRTPNPNENSFNTPKFGLSKDDLKDGQLLYQKLQEAKKADNKEAVEYYQKQLIESAK